MKFNLAIVLAALAVLSLAACSPSDAMTDVVLAPVSSESARSDHPARAPDLEKTWALGMAP